MKIAFDIGNVLVHFKLDVFRKEMNKHNLMPESDVDLFVADAEHLSYIGASTLEKQLRLKFPGLTVDAKNALLEAWNNTITPNVHMMNFMTDLKSEGVKIALLSNMGLEHAKHISKKYPEVFEGNFCHLSFEVGAFKPTKLFYQSFLLDHEDFLGCVYLDDLKENIEAGANFKFKGIHFDLNNYNDASLSILKKKLKEIKTKVLAAY